ncbi:MAG TPA: hypothetical protein VHM88_23235 [Candidatus Acidoferrales bacterium]|nr:hypothetical protein [Candidatus Acidoferrales bacterium]
MDLRRRVLNAAALEARERTARIRAAARKGKSPAEIAEAFEFPLKMVQQILMPVADARLSDPAQLLNTRVPAPGLPTANVQVYWVGFLTAAGRICGQGASFTLIVTLGDRSQEHVDTFMADLATTQVHHEFCRSSLLGWQFYVRDQSLCKALLPWGIPSDLDGDDPTVLDDLPNEFVAPFLRGYLDGDWAAPRPASEARSNGLVLHGTEAVLTGISVMVHRAWGIKGSVVTARPPRADLRFNRQSHNAILGHIRAYADRARAQRKRWPA